MQGWGGAAHLPPVAVPQGLSPWPVYGEDEVRAVADILRSGMVNYWTGTEGRAFEAEFAAWCETAHAVALHNGTVALEVALHALGVGPGDEVVVTPRSFIASASTVVNVGAWPVFADIDPVSQNLSAGTIEPVLTARTKAVIAVHLAGLPCDMDPIMALAAERGLKVIEDCAQAHGATYKGRMVGSIGHIGAWSFCQDKIMSTGGEGGMVTTNDRDLWSFMWSYKDHGKSWEAANRADHPPGFRWLHDSIGTNFRMLEMQATVGRIQLKRLPAWTARRAQIAGTLADTLAPFPAAAATPVPDGVRHAFYRFSFQVDPDKLAAGWTRDRIIADLVGQGIPATVGSCPELYRERAFRAPGLQPPRRLPNAVRVGARSIALPCHPTLTEADVAYMARTLRDTLVRAGG